MHADIFSGMIPSAEGGVLMQAMKNAENRGERSESAYTKGLLVPMNCHESSGLGIEMDEKEETQLCHPAVKSDREQIKTLPLVRLG